MIREQNLQFADAPNMAYDAVLTAGNFKPILFSTPMVKAILKGEKTQTRRLKGLSKINENPNHYYYLGNDDLNPKRKWGALFQNKITLEKIWIPFPVDINNILWVRETFCPVTIGYAYKADGVYIENSPAWVWKPSIFMPKKACRIFLRLTNIRIERLNEISELDAIREGVEQFEGIYNEFAYKSYRHNHILLDSPIESYRTLWEKINGEKSWEENPFVWVYEFERCEASFACS